MPFKVLSDNESKVCFEHPHDKNDRLYPEDISALILKYLLDMAQNKFKINNIKKCVISVPAYFDLDQRQATIKAGIKYLKLNIKYLKLNNKYKREIGWIGESKTNKGASGLSFGIRYKFKRRKDSFGI